MRAGLTCGYPYFQCTWSDYNTAWTGGCFHSVFSLIRKSQVIAFLFSLIGLQPISIFQAFFVLSCALIIWILYMFLSVWDPILRYTKSGKRGVISLWWVLNTNIPSKYWSWKNHMEIKTDDNYYCPLVQIFILIDRAPRWHAKITRPVSRDPNIFPMCFSQGLRNGIHQQNITWVHTTSFIIHVLWIRYAALKK